MSEVFCENCVAQSIDDDAGNTELSNGCGANFYGVSRRCPECGSRVRTLWAVMFFFPVFPVDTYRVIDIERSFLGAGGGKYYSRRMRLNLWQTAVTWLLASIVLALIAAMWSGAEPELGPDAVVGFSLFGFAVSLTYTCTMIAKKVLGDGCLMGLLCLTVFAAVIVGSVHQTWWRLEFHRQANEIRMAIALAAPFVLVALPGWIGAWLVHPSRVTPRIGPYQVE